MKPAEESPVKELKRFQKDNELCMKCGFCAGVCPTYREELVESSVARGRNALAKGLVKGELEFTPELAERLDKCTLCGSCTSVCPAHVDIPAVVIAARADKFRKMGLKFPYNIVYRSILSRRMLFGRTVRAAGWAQRLFSPKAEGTLRHLPNFMENLLNNRGRRIPQVAPKFLRQSVPVVNSPPTGTPTRFKVGYLTGCITEYVYPEIGKKVINFLTRNGVEVIVSREQGCCGAPVYMGAGDFVTGRKMADTNVAAFKNLDYIIVDCATCGSAIKGYAKYLADTPEHTKAYTEFGNRVMHITQFMVDVLKLPDSAYRAIPSVRGKTVTWHDPCHLVRHLGVRDQPRQILKAMKDIKYIEMNEADRCCGMAGGFSLHYYDLSSKIADRKYQNIAESKADIVVTGCPGCEIQLMDTLARHGYKAQVMNIMEILE